MLEGAVFAAVIITIALAIFVLRAERRHRRALRGHEQALLIRQGAIAAIVAPPIKDIVIPPPPRTPSEHRSRARWGMGGLAALPVVAWARDHHVPAILATAVVGGVLNMTPSLAPYESVLPPPPVAAPAAPLEPRTAPPTEPDNQTDRPADSRTDNSRGRLAETLPPPAQTPQPQPDGEPDEPGPTQPPQPPRDDPPPEQPPPEEPPTEPPPEEEPSCAEALPELDVDGCLAEVDQIIPDLS